MSPAEAYVQLDGQRNITYAEQNLAVRIGICTINKYKIQLGPRASTYTKNILICGVPGSVKSYVTKLLHLFALCRGLRVFPTAVMGVRASSMAGEHINKFFGLLTKKGGHVVCLAVLTIEKLHQKRNLLNLHAVLTMDILLYDEFGRLSAKALKILNIILCKVCKTSTLFGRVLIVANMDEAQFRPIDGLLILLLSHVLMELFIVILTESMRAHKDPEFCEIQHMTCMSPFQLRGNVDLEARFKSLRWLHRLLREFWDNVSPDGAHMYAWCKPA
jgi:hypothetical protein